MTVHDPDLQPINTAPPGPTEAEAGGILTIDLAAIEANWKKLSSMTLPVECAAVVKGDAYGCGLDPVTRKLAKAGCNTFFVADVAEGRRVRAIAPDADIYVLNGVMPGTAQSLADANLRPVINSTIELSEWDAFVSIKHWRGGAAIHVDTGMNRLGISPDEAIALAPRLQSANHGFTLLMSHLACSEIPDHPLNDRQVRLFREIRIMFRGLPSSLANSSGIFLGGTIYCDLVRPGVALYGANPTPGRPNPMQPVVSLKGRVIQVRNIPRGDTIGYGATFQAARDSRIATVAIGYGDGFLRVGQRVQEQGRRAGRDRGPALPDRRARLDGCVDGRRHRSGRGHGAPRRPRDADRRRPRHRRGRRRHGHGRLRGAHQSRQALSSHLQGRVTRSSW